MIMMMVMFPIRYGGLHYIPPIPSSPKIKVITPVFGDQFNNVAWKRTCGGELERFYKVVVIEMPILRLLVITMLLRTFYVRGFHNDY